MVKLPRRIWILSSILIGLLLWLALAYQPMRVRALLAEGRDALQHRRLDDAMRAFKKAEALDDDRGETQFWIARVYRHQGDPQAMRIRLQQAARLGYSAERIRREERLMDAQLGYLEESSKHLASMLEHAGEDGPEICEAFVNGYCLNLHFGAAFQLLDLWEADFPQDPYAKLFRGDIWLSRYEYAHAAEAYRQALALAPELFEARFGLGQALAEQNAMEEAERQFRACLQQRPRHLGAWLGLGNALLSQSRLEEARAAFQEVLSEEPRHDEAHRLLAEIELAEGKPQQVLDRLQPFVTAWPEDSATNYLYAKALQEVGRRDDAKAYFTRVEQAEPQLDRLEALFKLATENPTDVDVRYEIGDTLLRYRSRREGEVWLKSVLLLQPEHAAAHRALHEYYRKQGDDEQAALHARWVQETDNT